MWACFKAYVRHLHSLPLSVVAFLHLCVVCVYDVWWCVCARARARVRVFMCMPPVMQWCVQALFANIEQVNGGLVFDKCHGLTAITLQKLEAIGCDFQIINSPSLPMKLRRIEAPRLETVRTILNIYYNFAISSMVLPMLESVGLDLLMVAPKILKDLSLPALRSVGGNMFIDVFEKMTRLSAPLLASVGGHFHIKNAWQLDNICDLGLTGAGVTGTVWLFNVPKLVRGDASLLEKGKAKTVGKCRGVSVTIRSQVDYDKLVKNPDFQKTTELGHVVIADDKITARQVQVRVFQ